MSRVARVACLAAAVAVLAGCSGTPGSAQHAASEPKAAKLDIAKLGPVTLTEWDQQEALLDSVNKQFEAKYPNVHIVRVSKSFTNIMTSLRLAVSGPHPPDVVQGNQGWPVMGEMVKAGLLTPLDSYATLYGWDSRLPMSMRQPQMFSADGSQFGAGRLFGVPLDASVIGVYYNKQKLAALGVGVPQTFGEFEHDLALAKAAGQTPIKFGALDGWPAIHDFQAIQNAYVPQQSLIDLIYSRRGAKASFDTPQNVQAATTFRRWARAGYFGDGFLGIGYDSAEAQFAKGDGVFTITGEWEQPVFKTMGDNVGFFLMPPSTAGGTVIATGGPELPFSIPSGSEHKALAAAYIDFLLSTQTAAQMVRERYGTPAIVEPWGATPQHGTLFEQVASAIASVNEHNGLVEFLDYSTPTFYNTITAKLQELGAGRITPQQFTAALENDYADFQKTRAGGG